MALSDRLTESLREIGNMSKREDLATEMEHVIGRTAEEIKAELETTTNLDKRDILQRTLRLLDAVRYLPTEQLIEQLRDEQRGITHVETIA